MEGSVLGRNGKSSRDSKTIFERVRAEEAERINNEKINTNHVTASSTFSLRDERIHSDEQFESSRLQYQNQQQNSNYPNTNLP